MSRETVRVIHPLQPIRVSLSGLEIYSFWPRIKNLPVNCKVYKNLITALQAFLLSKPNFRASAQKHCSADCRARSLIMKMSHHDMKKENLGKNYVWSPLPGGSQKTIPKFECPLIWIQKMTRIHPVAISHLVNKCVVSASQHQLYESIFACQRLKRKGRPSGFDTLTF